MAQTMFFTTNKYVQDLATRPVKSIRAKPANVCQDPYYLMAVLPPCKASPNAALFANTEMLLPQ